MNAPLPDETVSIEISAYTEIVGSKVTRVVEFDLEDWQAMDANDREKVLLEALFDKGLISWDWKELP